jgi:spermidine/putrescine transport system substrate-binding protein
MGTIRETRYAARTMAGSLLIMLLGLAGYGGASAAELRVLNWQGYGTDEPWAIEMFETRTGVEVVHDYFTSEQEMLTRLRTSPGVYDVVLINSSFTRQAAAEGLIQPIDAGKISRFEELSPSLRGSPEFNIDGELYGIAWVWGVTSFAYNTERIPEAPVSIEALWDAKHAGRVGWRDDAVEAVQLAAIATGQDINAPGDMGAIRDKLRALKSQVRTFWSSEDEWNKHMASGVFDIAVYWSGSAARSRKAFGLPVAFVIPEEGAIGWLDGLSISAGAPNPETAHTFIDFMVSPEFYVPWDTNVGAPASANAAANAALPEDALNRAVLGDPAVVERLQFMAPLTDAQRNAWQELWDETKTYFAQ